MGGNTVVLVGAIQPEAWALVGIVVGALLGLLPKLFDLHSTSSRDEQEQMSRLRMMLANVLMNCVHSTNEFLNQAVMIRLDPAPSDGEKATEADLRKAIDLAFAMKTAWMDALVSFGDRVNDKDPVDRRRVVIQGMLKDLDDTYGIYQGAEVTPEQIIVQLNAVATLARTRLQQLIGLPAGP